MSLVFFALDSICWKVLEDLGTGNGSSLSSHTYPCSNLVSLIFSLGIRTFRFGHGPQITDR